MKWSSGVQVAVWVVLFALPAAAFGNDQETLDRAQKLAWNKHFAEAERIYRDVLERSPQSRDAALGLARVLLWEGHYRDARERFLTLDDREGAATAAYWQGDFRTAAREFRTIDSAFARESLAAIEQASRGTDRAAIDWLDDDQPFRVWRSTVTSTFFSNPLTRWDVAAGGSSLAAPEFDARRHLAFASVANETVLPWQRLTIDASLGVQRYPDGSSRPIGGATLRYRISQASSIAAIADHRELLTNATGLDTHPSVTRRAISWTRYAERSWLAGFETGALRYFDKNRGRYTHGYVLLPLAAGRSPLDLYAGASAAIRDTAENRFSLDAVSGTRSSGGVFAYGYRGSYKPYWTPKHLEEARAIVLMMGTAKRARWKAQFEAGAAHDTMTGFGPSSGRTPLPASVFAFDFRRTSHPTRGAITLTLPVHRYEIECTIERNTTAFYAANEIHASLVRHR